MKYILTLLILSSSCAFAELESTLNNISSTNEDVKKALYLEITTGDKFECKGQWTAANSLTPVLTNQEIKDWNFSYNNNSTNTIYAEAKSGYGKLSFTFEVSDDLKRVNSFTFEQWQVSMIEQNTGTLMSPVFEQIETKTNIYSSTCVR